MLILSYVQIKYCQADASINAYAYLHILGNRSTINCLYTLTDMARCEKC